MKLSRKNSKKIKPSKKSFKKKVSVKNRKNKRKNISKKNNNNNLGREDSIKKLKKINKNKRGGGEDMRKLQARIKELKNDLNMEKSINSKIKADMDKVVPAMTELKKNIVFQYNSFNELNELVGSIFGKKEI